MRGLDLMLVVSLGLFAVIAIAIWRRGPGAGSIAYALAAVLAICTLLMRASSGFFGFGTGWRIEAEYCGLVLTLAFVVLGFLRD